MRVSLLSYYNNNPHNLDFQAELRLEVDYARYEQSLTTFGSAEYDYWAGYIAGLNKR
ncbi:hypothetical protein [Hymenobacter cellulosivorans]|uniref:Uncharacterized protein n=1 Tax=Hymenobacter cellulosivorans TaxID=2932249 RepID=A0ABY4FDT1_9BACT|nr:hypothetical protein [Hymenobacter cellulosivorans]UOQ54833.1 hypothetical protein MUN80_08755 [Hymenobacter cellulosivorans]